MVKPRVPETNEGIQDEFDVKDYDIYAKTMRDRGWLETDELIKFGITGGLALEVGPGPGYVGLEWLAKTRDSRLEGLEISQSMIDIARKNAADYHLDPQRAAYVLGNAMDMPFPDDRFDAAFSCGSLHEWEDPVRILSEIHRVLKPGGRFFINDLRRDLPFFIKWFFRVSVRPKSMRPGLQSSLQASYTCEELAKILAASPLKNGGRITSNLFGLTLSGKKD